MYVCMYVCMFVFKIVSSSAFLCMYICMYVCKDMRCSVDLNVKSVSAYYFKRVQILSYMYTEIQTNIHTYIHL